MSWLNGVVFYVGVTLALRLVRTGCLHFEMMSWLYNTKKRPFLRALLVVLPGFEPRQAEPKSDVLPLHHRTSSISNYVFHDSRKTAAKVLLFFVVDKFFLFGFVLVRVAALCGEGEL